MMEYCLSFGVTHNVYIDSWDKGVEVLADVMAGDSYLPHYEVQENMDSLMAAMNKLAKMNRYKNDEFSLTVQGGFVYSLTLTKDSKYA